MPTLPPLPALEPVLATSYYWHLPVLIVIISLVYSATRFDEWGPILRESLRWGLRLAAFLGAIVLVLYVLATFI